MDIVLPKNNEAEFIEIASKLGIKKLYFLYNFDEYGGQKVQHRLESIKDHKNINIEIGFIANQKNLNKVFKQSRLIVVKSSDKDRYFIESKKTRAIYGFEETHKKDFLHQRASGLNHIMCELAKKNNVAVGFSYSLLFNKNPILASMIIGRMIQNISLCQKYKVKIVISSFSDKPFDMRSYYDTKSLFVMLGMDREKINESLAFNL